jgi:hypothetical protein
MKFCRTAIPVLLAFVAAFSMLPARSQSTHQFQVVNVGSQSIIHLYVSQSGSQNWGPDRLSAPLASRSAQPFNVPAGLCAFDVRAVYEDGHTVFVRGFDTCAHSTIAINYG